MSRWYQLRWSRVDNLIVHGALVLGITVTVLAASVLVPLARMVCDGVLRSRALGTEDFTFAVGGPDGVSLTHVFVGLVLAALAEVFRRGTRLREDVRGLV
jgi:hypothetical protein